MIACADARVDPRAVMVESFDTRVADSAMSGSVGPYDLAIRAKQDRVKVLQQLHESGIFWFLHVPWVSAHSHPVSHKSEEKQAKQIAEHGLLFRVY
jgi:hypothetical protein